MNAEHEHLASAYLDGELTDEERRAAETDPAVMAEVAALRVVRARVADVEPPAPAAREAAISAAMATFHELHPTEAVASAGASRPERRGTTLAWRRRDERVRWLGAAAAVVLVGALGFVVVRGIGGDDDQSADELVAEQADTTAQAAIVPTTSATRLTEEAELGATDATDEATGASDDAEESLAASAATELAPEAAAEEPAGDTAMAPPLLDPSVHFDDDVAIESPLQLRSAAQYLVDQRDLGELGPTPEYSCPYYDVLGVADYDDDGRMHEVLIDVDESADLVTAVDRDTCEPVTSIALTP
jgi:hypothetical protein